MDTLFSSINIKATELEKMVAFPHTNVLNPVKFMG